MTHLVIFKMHTSSLDCPRAGLITDFVFYDVLLLLLLLHPWMPLSGCVTWHWECEGSQEAINPASVYESVMHSWQMQISAWEVLQYF